MYDVVVVVVVVVVVFDQVEEFQNGDVVRVSNEIALVHLLQENHGGWVDDMVLVCCLLHICLS